jgi:hypothetical protein
VESGAWHARVGGLSDASQQLYSESKCRLLRLNIAEAERIINPPLAGVASFSEALTPEMKDAIFKEFNTLSVVYQVRGSGGRWAHLLLQLLLLPNALAPLTGWNGQHEDQDVNCWEVRHAQLSHCRWSGGWRWPASLLA